MSIVQNRKAFHDYFIEERYEAGLALQGWEVKAIRAGRAQLADAYVIIDLPDPNNESLGKLYTRSFYRLVAKHLAPQLYDRPRRLG